MTHRSLTTTLGIVTLTVVALAPSSAGASPAPDPSSHTSPAAVSTASALHQLQGAYRKAPVEQKMRIHNAIALIINTGHAAL